MTAYQFRAQVAGAYSSGTPRIEVRTLHVGAGDWLRFTTSRAIIPRLMFCLISNNWTNHGAESAAKSHLYWDSLTMKNKVKVIRFLSHIAWNPDAGMTMTIHQKVEP